MRKVIVADRYQLEECLQGQQSTIAYRAISKATDQPCLVLFLRLPADLTREFRLRFVQRFHRGVQILQALPTHPALIGLVDAGIWRSLPYLVYPEDALQASFVSSLPSLPLAPDEALALMQYIADGLAHAHIHGIVHGNLTLSSLICSLDPGVPVRIAGLGLRSFIEAEGVESVTRPYDHLRSIWGTYVGDPTSLAPEILFGQPWDEPCDVYALGSVFARMLGEFPQEGGNYLQIAMDFESRSSLQHFPEPIVSILRRMLAPHPDQRFSSLKEVSMECARLCR